jgi:hypothetical protein
LTSTASQQATPALLEIIGSAEFRAELATLPPAIRSASNETLLELYREG